MDNAAPLGKPNWISLYGPQPPEMAVTRPVFLPSALDAAGSSTPNTPLIDEGDELEENDNENEIIELGKHKLGEDASEGEIQNFKDDYIEDKHTESQIEDEELEDDSEMMDENNEGEEIDVL